MILKNNIKNLTVHFKSNVEKERKYLTYELHEELAQLAFAIKMDVECIAENTSFLSESSKTSVEHALANFPLTY